MPGRIVDAVFDGGRRESQFFGALAVLLVLVRAAAFTLSERISFNSDQAIVGLMAKHASEFRDFSFFYYGQNYMLAVQAWVMVPFFWIARPSVSVMRMPLVILNVAAALLLMRSLRGRIGLRPAVGFFAALPFTMPTPVVAGSFLGALGSTGVEPLLYLFDSLVPPRSSLRVRRLAGDRISPSRVYALCSPRTDRDSRYWIARCGPGRRGGGRSACSRDSGSSGSSSTILRLHIEGASLLLHAQMPGSFVCFRPVELMDRIRYVIRVC